MGMEDAETQGANTTVTRYGLGARGVDLIERTGGGTTTTGFPLYDAHGNNVATLSRAPNGGYSVNDRRSYDAWGKVRAQQSGGDPKLRYCASLGHRQDDESGLVYMRARYYEPTSGRFVSEDPARDGGDWFAYCDNDPVNMFDWTGKAKSATALLGAAVAGFVGYLVGLALGDNQLLQLAFAIGSSVLSGVLRGQRPARQPHKSLSVVNVSSVRAVHQGDRQYVQATASGRGHRWSSAARSCGLCRFSVRRAVRAGDGSVNLTRVQKVGVAYWLVAFVLIPFAFVVVRGRRFGIDDSVPGLVYVGAVLTGAWIVKAIATSYFTRYGDHGDR